MDIFRMRCFVSAARTLNYSQTARELFITQPAVTQQISAIEKELGVRLFAKKGRKLYLTGAGEMLAEGFENIINSYDCLTRYIKRMQAAEKELRIGYHGPLDWGTMTALMEGYEYKDTKVQFNLRTDHWGPLVHDLNMGLLDFVFTEKAELASYPDLAYIELFREEGVVCLSKKNPLSRQEKLQAEQLRGEQLIMTTSPKPSNSMNAIIERLEAAGLDMDQARYVNQYETAVTLAAAGMGVTFLPKSFSIYEHPALAFVPLDHMEVFIEMVLAYMPQSITPPAQAFLELCKTWDFAKHSERT